VIERRRRVEEVLESMGRMVVPVPDESDAEREQVVDALNRQLELAGNKRSARTRQRWVLASVAAALCLSAGSALLHFRRAEPASPVAVIAAPGADVFKRGDALRTDAQETRTGTLENGAQVQLGHSTELTVSALELGNDELVLDRGRVDLTVPKLHSGHTLSVTTPDSTVTVRGTRFSVEVVLTGSGAITNVEVTQGSVWVRQGDTRLVLVAGSRWSSGQHATTLLADPLAPAAALPTSAPGSAPAAVAAGPGQTKSVAGLGATPALSGARPLATPALSTLAEENELYTAAARAAREGNETLAVSELSALLTRYPSSPLAQNARVDRFRALMRSGRAQEAAAQARGYLADYPNGFARDEAKALVLRSLAKQ
jgi:ferric-dicitrate binding protein FerR (iron transport regulator)